MIIDEILPPQIKQMFQKALLSTPTPDFRDTLDKLWRILLYIEGKVRSNIIPSHLKKFELLKKQFTELYVRTLAKEKEIKKETKTQATEPFYYITHSDKVSRDLFFRLRQASYSISSKLRYNDEI